MKTKLIFLAVGLFMSIFSFGQFPDVPRGALGKEQYIALLIEKLKVAENNKDTLNSIRFASILATQYQTTSILERSNFYITLAKNYAESYSDSSWMGEVSNRLGMFVQGLANRANGEYSDLSSLIQLMDSSIWWHKNAIKLGFKYGRIANAGWGYRGVMESVNAKYLKTKVMEDSMEFFFARGLEISKTANDRELSNSMRSQYVRFCLNTNQLVKARKTLELMDPNEFEKMSVQNHIHDLIAKENSLDTLEVIRQNIWTKYKMRLAAEHDEILYETDQKYEVSKTRGFLRDTRSQLENSQTLILIVISIACLILGISFYLFYLFRKNKRLSQRNKLLLKEQNHRVKNNLQMINSLLSLQSKKLLSTDAKEALNESQLRINSVALLHRMLYEGEQMGKINVAEYMKSLADEISYAAPRKVEVNVKISTELSITVEKATSLGLIINELMTNSIKHVSEEVNLKIELSIQLVDSTEMLLSYIDNGEGIGQEIWNTSTSFGNQLIKIQSDQLRGEYKVVGKKGFRYELRVGA